MLHLEINVAFGCRLEAKHVARAVASRRYSSSSLLLLTMRP